MSGRIEIDLAKFKTSPESRSFSGRPRGEFCRAELGLDSHDVEGAYFVIRIPSDTYAINMSFFLGLFGPSVRYYGKQQFEEHFKFEGSQHILRVLPKYIDEALVDEIALPEKKTA